MKNSNILRFCLALGFLAGLTPFVRADHHEPEMLTQKIQQFYALMREGNQAEAFQFVKNGSAGFLPFGMLVEIPNDDVKAMIAEQAKAERAKGNRAEMFPKHIQVKMLGSDHAVATYYVEGGVTEDGEERHMLARASLVLAKDGDDWKIVHWHISELQKAPE